METAKLLLGHGKELNAFVSRLLDDIGNLKAMLHAISIGAQDQHLTLFSRMSTLRLCALIERSALLYVCMLIIWPV